MTQNPKTSFKKVNIPWIWEIPEDWGVKKLKFISKIRSSNIDKNDDYEIETFVVNYNDVIRNPEITDSTLLDRTSCTESQLQSFSLTENDLIVTKDSMDVRNIADISIVHSKKEWNLVCGYHLYIIRVTDSQISQKYLYYLLQNKGIKQYFLLESRGTTIIWLSNDSLANTAITFPKDKFTQTAITKFLDQKTAEIKKFIDNKWKLIELLKEQKQSIIHRAVTKGIDPNTKMKDSGIPWIGEIPEGWEVVKLKYLGRIRSWDGIENTQIKSEWDYEVYWWNGFMGYTDTYNVSEMSIIIGRVGAKCWNVRLINERKWISDNALVLSLFNSDNYNFLAQLLEIMNLNTLSVSNAQPLITGTVVMNQFIPLPSSSVQYKIFEYVKQETSQIDFAIEKIEKEIILIEEYQTSLIYQAVTGKISIS